jgi:hypothetical protein
MALSAPPRPGATKPAPAPVQYLLPPDFDQFAERAGYHAESDGRVYTLNGTTKSYVPPWIVWQNSDTGKTPDGQLTKEGMSYRIPGSDPSSAWNFMYEKSGPFRKGSQWDDKQGTYKGSIDWMTLIGTALAGGVIAAGATAALGGIGGAGGAGADVGAATTVPELGAAAPVLEGTAAGAGATGTAAGLGTAPIAGETAATTGVTSGAGLPGAVAAPAVGDLATGGSAIAGTTGPVAASTPGILSKSLSALSTPSVLSTIAQGAFGVYGASQAAGAQTDAAKIVADANTAAAKIQADASTEAARIQAESTKNALDFAKQGYNNEIGAYNTNQQQLSPYTGAGGAAVTKLSQLLGLGTPSSNVTPLPTVPIGQSAAAAPVAPGSAATGPNSFKVVSNPGSVSSLAPPQSATQQMVTLRAPTGETTQKPASEAPHWIALGAQPVQQGATV